MAAWRGLSAVGRRCSVPAFLSRAAVSTVRATGTTLHRNAYSSVAVQGTNVAVRTCAVMYSRNRFFSAEERDLTTVSAAKHTSSLPPHKTVTLPALSPTMEVGSLVGWEKAEGELVEEGDVLARVETDKASMEMEAPHTGYVAKIVVPEGTRDIPLGKVICIIVEKESDVSAFSDYQPPEKVGGVTPPPSEPPQQSAPAPSPPPPPTSALPPHKTVTLPALSPTMEVGSLVGWEKAEGELVEEGDVLARVETDKASMEMEAPHTGYVAKIVVPEGTRDIPLGKLLCIITEKEEDVAAFKDYQEPPTHSPQQEKAAPKAGVSVASPPAQPAPPTDVPSMPLPSSTRVFVSPYARSILAQQGRTADSLQGTGYSGAVTSRDVIAAVGDGRAAAAGVASGSFTEVPLTGMRKTIAQRLVQSKRDIPHYYLTVDINMDNIISVRKAMNEMAGGKYKLSVNDFLIKAAALALRKMPEVNSSWTDTAIRRYNTVDVSMAVSTDGGLITPIVFDADEKGLRTISEETKMLAEKARLGKLQPQEFQGGTFTISNLGMYGIKSFTAVINPPQACILAVGGAEKRPVADDKADVGFTMANMMCVTLSCDHRVVDGAVGAQWLDIFKKLLEQPHSMLL